MLQSEIFKDISSDILAQCKYINFKFISVRHLVGCKTYVGKTFYKILVKMLF